MNIICCRVRDRQRNIQDEFYFAEPPTGADIARALPGSKLCDCPSGWQSMRARYAVALEALGQGALQAGRHLLGRAGVELVVWTAPLR